jgi:hypothetical protein
MYKENLDLDARKSPFLDFYSHLHSVHEIWHASFPSDVPREHRLLMGAFGVATQKFSMLRRRVAERNRSRTDGPDGAEVKEKPEGTSASSKMPLKHCQFHAEAKVSLDQHF